jgi:hypothetical protein
MNKGVDLTTTMNQICVINPDNHHLSISLSHLPKLKTNEEISYCTNYMLCTIQDLLVLNERIDIDLYITEDIKMEMFQTIKMFFDLFKRELPNKLNKCRIHTKAKYKGLAHMFLTFADRETKSRMEILSI